MSNIQPYIIINGVNSRTISGLLITSLPPISKPQQRTQVETVDGRSGDIITPLGFSAYDKTVSIGLTYNYDIDEVIEFFNTSGTVIFSNEPTKYYRFAIYEQIDFEKLIRFKTAEVVLHVQPYKFSTTEEPLLFNDPTEISVENNGNTDARPNLLITGSGEIDVSLNGSQLLSMDLGEDEQTVIIDSENMNAYGAQSAIREVVANIEPKQAGSGNPSPDNIREISGYSEANITRCGVNLFDGILEKGYISTTTGEDTPNESGNQWRCKNYILVKPNISLYMKLPYGYTTNNSNITVYYYDANKNFIGYEQNKGNLSVTTPNNCYYFRFCNYVVVAVQDAPTENSLNYPATDTQYHVYNGNTYAFAFGQTIYGGLLNVTTGECDNLCDIVTDLSQLSWIYHSGWKVFYANLPVNARNRLAVDLSCCEIYSPTDKPLTTETWSRLDDHTYVMAANLSTSGRCAIVIKDLSYTDKTTFANSLIDKKFVYPLATPTTVQLTPTQINNLLGLNNLYSNTGALSVKYKSGGVIQTQSGDIVTFTIGVGDMDKGTLLNRLITGNYDKIRLKKGDNVISFTGNVNQVSIDKYSRWI